LASRGSTFAVMTFASTHATKRFEPRDVELFQELAARAAIAVDNARLYTEAQEANRAKDEFLANISHELRTPMTAILGWAHLLAVSDLAPDDVRLGISTIRQSAQAQAKLIDDLLDVSRIITGKLHLTIAPTDMSAVARDAVAAIRPAAAAKRQNLTLDVGEGPPLTIAGDAARLQQVLWNLLSNAVKFTPAGGSISMIVNRSGDTIEVQVCDSGEGIAAEFLPVVFDRFRQLGKAAQSRAGLGIGLAIAKELVEMHGGSIHAESQGRGRGSKFTIVLPEAPVDSAIGDASGDRPLRLRGIRVLLAEDDETTRTLLTALLRSFGATVRAARSAAEALAAYQSFAPQVIVSDIAMPGEDGVSLLHQIRAGRESSAPAIAVTAFADDASRSRILAAGFEAFVSKPIDPHHLASLVEQLVTNRTQG
jgi:signal transduction histidine kinase